MPEIYGAVSAMFIRALSASGLKMCDASGNALLSVENDGVLFGKNGNKDIVFYRQISLAGITSWTTILTITANTLIDYTVGQVKAILGGHTSGVGNGFTQINKAFSTYGGNPVQLYDIEPDIRMHAGLGGNGAPHVQLAVSGNSVLVQVQSSNGSNSFVGSCHLEIFCPRGISGVVTWSIT